VVEEFEFDVWYRREHPRVVSAVAAITGRPSVAREATAEAFVRAYERWDRVRVMASAGGWVHRTALNAARRQLRRAAVERRLLRRVALAQPGEAPPPDWSPELWAVLRELPRREREAIVLRHVADLPVAAVAGIMGITVGTASWTLRSARDRLNRALGGHVDDRPTPRAGPARTAGLPSRSDRATAERGVHDPLVNEEASDA
jgi:RNA polymerase sigma-70 factor (ECF subfamily)